MAERMAARSSRIPRPVTRDATRRAHPRRHRLGYLCADVGVFLRRPALISDVSYRKSSTGRVLRMRIASFLRLQDGRVIEYREFIDSFDALEQALGRQLQF